MRHRGHSEKVYQVYKRDPGEERRGQKRCLKKLDQGFETTEEITKILSYKKTTTFSANGEQFRKSHTLSVAQGGVTE